MTKNNWKSSISRFLFAQTISLLGSSIVQYAIIWHIILTTSSGGMLAISTACGFLPQILISLFAGVWIDRFNRKKIIMISDTVIALSTLILAVTLLMGETSSWLLFAALIIRSAGTGVQTPTVNAIIPQIVPSDKLMKINGINSTLSSIIMFSSPVISGAVLSLSSLEAALFIDVITAIIGVGVTASIFVKPHQSNSKAGISNIDEIKTGFSYLKQNQFMRRLLTFQVIILFLISPSAFLTPLMVSRTFGEEIWRLTASEMAYSLGMILGGILITSWGGFRKKLNTTILAGAIYGVVMVGLGGAPWFVLYLILNTLIGITSPCYNAPLTVTIQEQVPPHMLGRVFSFMQIASSCALPIGMVFFGPLADVVEVQWLLMGSGILVLFITSIIWKRNYLFQNNTIAETS